MDICTSVGSCVVFIGKNGYPAQLSHALSILKVGHNYQVSKVVIGDWETRVYLEGVPGSFNSVMFENATATPVATP